MMVKSYSLCQASAAVLTVRWRGGGGVCWASTTVSHSDATWAVGTLMCLFELCEQTTEHDTHLLYISTHSVDCLLVMIQMRLFVLYYFGRN